MTKLKPVSKCGCEHDVARHYRDEFLRPCYDCTCICYHPAGFFIAESAMLAALALEGVILGLVAVHH